MVRHNNVQSPPLSSSTPGVSGHSTGGSSKSSRLLPYPPIVGEAELFHPRPRMGVGVGGLAGELENGLDEDELGDESTYHSALDIQTDIDDLENGGGGEGSTAISEEASGSGNDIEPGVGSDATNGVEYPNKAKEEGEEVEETSIQDLLLPQSQTRPRVVPAVEACEMELGETVNNSNGISAAAATAGDGSISSIGGTKTRTKPRKRELMGEIRRVMGEVDSLSKMTGDLGADSELIEAPSSVESCAEGNIVDDDGSAASASTSAALSISRQSALDERESKIAILESSLDVRESAIAERDTLITKRESSIADRESSITDRESSLDNRESTIASRESTISKLESDITARESTLTISESEIQRRVGDIEQREMEVEKREFEVEKREREVSERETRAEKKESDGEKREKELSEYETRVERREVEVKEWYQRKLSEIDERMLAVDVPVPPPITAFAAASSSTPAASTSTCTAKSKWSPSPMEFARRLCANFLFPVLGEERTPRILLPGNGVAANSSSTSSSTTSTTLTTSTSSTTSSFPTLPSVPLWPLKWSLKGDLFLNQLLGATVGGGSFLVLVGIGICVIFLRGVARKVFLGGFGRR